MGSLERRFREQDPVIGEDADRIAEDMGEAGDQRGPVERLEFVEPAPIDDARNDFAHLVGFAVVRRHDARDIRRIVLRLDRLPADEVDPLPAVERRDRAPDDGDGMGVVLGIVVGHAGLARVHVGTAELLGAHHLARRRLHQRRPAEEDRALVADDHRLVRHRGHIGAARGARAHHGGDLRDAGRRHGGLVVEDASEMIAVGKDLVLARQVGAPRVDQIDAGQVVLARDVLRAEVLLDGEREIGAALHGGVIGDDHAFGAHHRADAGDQPGRRHVLVIDLPCGELGELEKRRAGVDQAVDPLPRQHLAARDMALPRPLSSAPGNGGDHTAEIRDRVVHRGAIGLECFRAPVDRASDRRHHAVSRNNSRPISMRRISLVPAPISYSLASRSSRPVGYSLT